MNRELILEILKKYKIYLIVILILLIAVILYFILEKKLEKMLE
jgi:hypothetical protein